MKFPGTVLTAAFLLSAFAVCAQSAAINLKWEPVSPKPGEKINIQYEASKTNLAGSEKITALAYCFQGFNPAVLEIPLQKSGDRYSGSFTTDTGATVIAFLFKSEDKKDANGNEGYILRLSDQNGKPLPASYGVTAMIYSGFGNYLLGMDAQPEKSLEYLEKGYQENPSLRADLAAQYFQTLYQVKKKDAKEEIIKHMEALESAGAMNETLYNQLAGWYSRFEMEEKAGALTKAMKEKFPEGEWVRQEKMRGIFQEKDPARKSERILAVLEEHPALTENHKRDNEYLYSQLATIAAKAGKWNEFSQHSAKMSTPARYALYNNLAWELAEAGRELEASKKISLEATEWARKEMDQPTADKPAIRTASEWKDERRYTYSMFADTYAFFLYQ